MHKLHIFSQNDTEKYLFSSHILVCVVDISCKDVTETTYFLQTCRVRNKSKTCNMTCLSIFLYVFMTAPFISLSLSIENDVELVTKALRKLGKKLLQLQRLWCLRLVIYLLVVAITLACTSKLYLRFLGSIFVRLYFVQKFINLILLLIKM